MAIVLAVAVVAVAAFSYYWPRPPGLSSTPPPTFDFSVTLSKVANGSFHLALPYMILHNPDNRSIPNVTFRNEVRYTSTPSEAANVTITFEPSNSLGLPVVFVQLDWWYNPRVISQNLTHQPAGECGGGCLSQSWSVAAILPNRTVYVGLEGTVEYTVYRGTLSPPGAPTSWVVIEYRFVRQTRTFAPAELNLSDPSPKGLVPAGDPVVFPVSSWGSASETVSVRDMVDPNRVFRYALPPVSFDAGPLGSIQVNLTSQFSWGSTADQWFKVTGTADHDVQVQMYVDTRFGALYPVLLG